MNAKDVSAVLLISLSVSSGACGGMVYFFLGMTLITSNFQTVLQAGFFGGICCVAVTLTLYYNERKILEYLNKRGVLKQ